MGTIARNEITGKCIKTNPQNAQYAAGWDRIFAKKNISEWVRDLDGVEILSEIDMGQKISYTEYRKIRGDD